MTAPAGAAELRVVRLLNVPVQAQLENLRHLEDLVQELQVIRVGDQTGTAAAGPRLARLINNILRTYATARQESFRQALEAERRGKERFDLALELPPAAADAALELLGLLESAEELCRANELLTLAPSERVAALRRWQANEIATQLHDAPPTPCPL